MTMYNSIYNIIITMLYRIIQLKQDYHLWLRYCGIDNVCTIWYTDNVMKEMEVGLLR